MRWMLIALAGPALFAFACNTDDDSDGTIRPDGTSAATTPSASPTPDSSLGSIEALIEQSKPLLARALDVDEETISDIDLEGRNLTITMEEDQTLGGPADFQEACENLTNAIGFTDVNIVIMSTSGSELAECSMSN